MKKNLLKFVALMFLLTFCFNYWTPQASAAYACSPDENRCVDAMLNYRVDTGVKSYGLYFSQGEKVEYSWDNDSPGLFQVTFYAQSGDGKHTSDKLYAAREGNMAGYWTIPASGFYYLYAYCESGKDNRCQCGGSLAKW